MKILILVMSSEVEEYPKLVWKQKQTWDSVKHPDVTTIYYYAGSSTQLYNNRLDIDIEEGTGNFYRKTIKAFEAVMNLEWDYIFKTDNSAYVVKEALHDLLLPKPRDKYVGGHLYTPKSSIALPFLWGEGFALSRDVVEYLIEEYKGCELIRSGVEDVHIGMILKKVFNWDTSLTVLSFYPDKKVRYNHIYRCKPDSEKASKFEACLTAMETVHIEISELTFNRQEKKKG